MPSKSKQQQKFMGIVRAIQKGEAPAGKFSKAAQKAAKSMKKGSVRKYAKTKHDDLPKKVKEERDYKDEYKKFQSSTKSKKYRAELNKYNRKKGTYGNGDGKDASHKGGKIVGFESESKNRGRAEKSRLKKEGSVNEAPMELNKIKDAIKMFQKKIEKQGRVTNARDEEHLKNLIKLYIQMGGRGVKESKLNENPAAMSAVQAMTKLKMNNPKTGKKVSAASALKNKDNPNHKKAKSIFQRLKDKFSKKKKEEPKKQSKADADFYKRQYESVNEGQKREASNILRKFDMAYIKFSREIRDVIKMMDRSTGSKVDGKIIEKAYGKGLIPLNKLMIEWDRGQQSNPGIDEAKDPDIISKIRDVLKNGITNIKDPVSGKNMKVDSFSASAITQVYDKINRANKKKFVKLSLPKMAKLAMKFVK